MLPKYLNILFISKNRFQKYFLFELLFKKKRKCLTQRICRLKVFIWYIVDFKEEPEDGRLNMI
jgi:hypothetical protein